MLVLVVAGVLSAAALGMKGAVFWARILAGYSEDSSPGPWRWRLLPLLGRLGSAGCFSHF